MQPLGVLKAREKDKREGNASMILNNGLNNGNKQQMANMYNLLPPIKHQSGKQEATHVVDQSNKQVVKDRVNKPKFFDRRMWGKLPIFLNGGGAGAGMSVPPSTNTKVKAHGDMGGRGLWLIANKLFRFHKIALRFVLRYFFSKRNRFAKRKRGFCEVWRSDSKGRPHRKSRTHSEATPDGTTDF